MKTYAKILQRLLDAMAFANAGNQREFERMLEDGERRRLAEKRSTARRCGTAARRSRRRAPAAFAVPQL